MAAAFGIPVTVLYGNSDPVVWAPWQADSQVLTAPDSIAGIAVQQVISAIEELRVRR
jgi:ADP-heptose:LPS heptosyltransferase